MVRLVQWARVGALASLPALVAACGSTTDDAGQGGGSGGGGAIPSGSGGKSLDGGSWPDGGGLTGSGGASGGSSSGGAGSGGGASGGSPSGGSSSGGSSSGGAGSGGGPSGGSGGGSAETCNNKDDDNDGQIDENLSQSCTSACGSGTQTCSAGQWGACSAGLPKSCMNYSTCNAENQCVASCPSAPAESCNLKDDNCDSNCDGLSDCRVAVHRSFRSSNSAHFYTTSLSEASCCGFGIEMQDYFYLYKAAAAGLSQFHRCLLANGKHFYTTSSSCEGAAGSTYESALGYIASSAVCGAIPLYRLAHQNGDHVYTTSASERATAIGNGWIDEGTAGYVWSGP